MSSRILEKVRKDASVRWLTAGLPVLVCLLVFGISFLFPKGAEAGNIWLRSKEPFVIAEKSYYSAPSSNGFIQKGFASWYGPPFHGRKTSSGELYNMHSLTAAHKTLPMDTVLLVKNLENGKNTLVRVNDRGPLIRGRIIDLSYKAAKSLGVVGNGTAKVQIVTLGNATGEGETATPSDEDYTLGEFFVQIGSFAKESNAARLKKRFTDAGHTTIIHKSFNPRDILYGVRVYVGKTLHSAKTAEKALIESGYTGAFVIAR